MGNDIIQAQYDQLAAMANRFGAQAESNQHLIAQLRQAMQPLQGGGWQGRGSAAFFGEMNGAILPAMQRLSTALGQARSVTLDISSLIHQAEEEASRPFRTGTGAAFLPGGGAFPGASDGYSTGGGGGWTGGLDGGGGGGSGGGSAGGSILDRFKLKNEGTIWQFDRSQPSGKRSKFDPGLNIKYGVGGALYGDPDADGFSAFGGEAGIQAGLGVNGFSLGPYGEYYTAQGKLDGVYGDENLALTGGIEGKVLSADGFLGVKDNSFGASIGASLVSVKGESGVNVAGINVGVSGEVGLKAELGFKIGQKTEIKLPFVTFGFSFGGAKKDQVR